MWYKTFLVFYALLILLALVILVRTMVDYFSPRVRQEVPNYEIKELNPPKYYEYYGKG